MTEAYEKVKKSGGQHTVKIEKLAALIKKIAPKVKAMIDHILANHSFVLLFWQYMTKAIWLGGDMLLKLLCEL